MMIDYEKHFSAFFNEAADMAGAIALQYFRNALSVDEKDDRSPVTQADRQIEQKFRELLNKAYPDHGVIGEEYGKDRPEAEFVWVIDPIDGTRAFMTGKPLFGTIIGLMHNGKPAMGAIEQAFIKERWLGVTDRFARYNGNPIKVAPPRDLDTARLYTGAAEMFHDSNSEQYSALCRAARWQQYGCDCYAYGLLAMGWADLVVEQKLGLHDAAGIVPIVTGAGGFIGDWNLNPIGFNFDGHMIAASSKALAVQTAEILNKNAIS